MTHGPEEVNVAVALLLPAAVATLSSAMSPSDVIIRDVNPLPAALLVGKQCSHRSAGTSTCQRLSSLRQRNPAQLLDCNLGCDTVFGCFREFNHHAGTACEQCCGHRRTTVLVVPSNNTAGNWIGVCTRAGAANESFTVVDSKGNVYRKAIQHSETNDGNSFGIYYAENIAGGANAIRVSDTTTATLRVAILEYSGVATSESLDVIAAAQGHNATPNSGATGSTTASGDLLLGTIMMANSARFTAGSGYATVESVPTEPRMKLLVESQIQATAWVVTASARLGSTDF
jgi:hypothetical protein